MTKTAWLLCVAVLGLVPTLSAQNSWYVDGDAFPGGNGSTLLPFQKIMDAVNAAASGDSIYLAPGIHDGSGVDLGTKNLTIASQFGASTVVIAQDPMAPGYFKIDGPATGLTTLNGLTFSGFSSGYNSPWMIWMQNTQVAISNCVFLDSNIGFLPTVGSLFTPPTQILIDGSVFDESKIEFDHEPTSNGMTAVILNTEFKNSPHVPSLTYSQVIIDNCHYHDYGRMKVFAAGGTINNCLFEGDGISFYLGLELGGTNIQVTSCTFNGLHNAVYLEGDSHVIEGSTFQGCFWGVYNRCWSGVEVRGCTFEAQASGTVPSATMQNGITSIEGDILVDACTFRGLQASSGTAVNVTKPLVMTNCLIESCTALNGGGAVSVSAASFEISNCTFVGNSAPVGSTLLIAPGANGSVKNSIIRDASAQAIDGQPWMSYCNVEGGWSGPGHDNVDLDPLFVDAANGDFHLMNSSPCVDAGDHLSDSLPLYDLDGNPRRVGYHVDLGCFENPTIMPLLGGTEDDFLMIARSDGARINGDQVDVSGGEIVSLHILSPGHELDDSPVWVVGEIFPTGSSPVTPFGHPAVHVNLGVVDVLFDSTLFAPFSGLPTGGIDLFGSVPGAVVGYTYRLQTFTLATTAQNGSYAASRAVDLRFP